MKLSHNSVLLALIGFASVKAQLATYSDHGLSWNGTCSTGVRQSPINFNLANANITWQKVPTNVTNQGPSYSGGSGSPAAWQAVPNLTISATY